MPALTGAVEHLTVDQFAGVVDFHLILGGWALTVTFFNHFVLETGLCGLNAFTLGVFSQESLAGILVLLSQFFQLLLLLLLELLLVGHQRFLDLLAGQSLAVFITGMAMLDALKELVHLEIRQVVAHALTQHQSHAIADFLGRGFKGRVVCRLLGC